MVDQETLMQALSDFTPSLVNPILGANLQELVERVSGVSGISWAGVGMAGGGRLGFATAVDGYTSRVEQVHENHQQGRCVAAHEHSIDRVV